MTKGGKNGGTNDKITQWQNDRKVYCSIAARHQVWCIFVDFVEGFKTIKYKQRVPNSLEIWNLVCCFQIAPFKIISCCMMCILASSTMVRLIKKQWSYIGIWIAFQKQKLFSCLRISTSWLALSLLKIASMNFFLNVRDSYNNKKRVTMTVKHSQFCRTFLSNYIIQALLEQKAKTNKLELS